jgi:hypothetical protein
MRPAIKCTIAVVAGLVLGSAVNMGLIMTSGLIIPPPNGVDVADMESMQASMHLFEPRHFVFPFLWPTPWGRSQVHFWPQDYTQPKESYQV